MSETRKPRAGKMDTLPPGHLEQLERWLTKDNLPYREVSQRVKLEFGVKIAPSTLSEFFQRMMARKLQVAREVRLEIVIPVNSAEPIRVQVIRDGVKNTQVEVVPL